MREQSNTHPTPKENVKPLIHQFGSDEDISNRHRNFFGYNMPLLNFDFIGMHYDQCRVTDFVEFKHCNIKSIDLRQANYRAIQDASDKLGVPFFVIVYDPEDWSYFMLQFNMDPGVKRHVARPTAITERNLVSGLYRIRGRTCPPEVLKDLAVTLLPKEKTPVILGL